MDSPDSPLRQQGTSPPPTKGRGGGTRHYMSPAEDAHFHPSQRRPLLVPPGPVPPKKFIFHNTRVQDMAPPPAPRLETKSLLPTPIKELARRGGYMPTSPVSRSSDEGDLKIESSEADSQEQQASRDPRLKRKLPSQTPEVVAPKRKPDLHLVVHQILSEHSYCKGGGIVNEPQLELQEIPSSAKVRGSSFLSVIGNRVWSRVRYRSVIRKELKTKLNTALNRPVFKSCSKHFEQLRMYCVTCAESICKKCAAESSIHHGHDYGVLKRAWDGGREALLVKLESQTKPMVSDKKSSSEVPLSTQPEDKLKLAPSPPEAKPEPTKEVIESPKEVETPMELTAVEPKAEEGEVDEDSAIDDDFYLDIDSDGFSSSDEVMPSPAEGITVEPHRKREQSYIISLPTCLSPSRAKPLTDATMGSGASHIVAKLPTDTTIGSGTSCTDTATGAVGSGTGGHTVAKLLTDALPSTASGTSHDSIPAVPAEVTEEEALNRATDSNAPKDGPTQWSITNFDPRKNLIRLSKVDLQSRMGQDSYIGQMISNRLALYASNSSPSGSSVAESSEFSRSEDSLMSWGEGDLESLSLSSFDSNSSLVSSLGEERGRTVRSGRGIRGGHVHRKRQWRKCMQMSTRRTRAAKMADAMVQKFE